MFGFTPQEISVLRKLSSPQRIQDFLDSLPMNFEHKGETCLSPRGVLRERTAHCMEGAMLAAVCLRLLGRPPLVMDLKSRRGDDDHVVALFTHRGRFGAISKTNHGVLRYRDPVYRSLRELAMSYFHEYFLDDGTKTLRSHSVAVDLSRFDARGWMTSATDVWYVPRFVDAVRHIPLFPPGSTGVLRKADAMERRVTAPTEWVFRHGAPRKASLHPKRR